MANQRSLQIQEEMIQLSVDVITLCQKLSLPSSVVSQVTRSVTSIGANFTEAQDASSKRDFINKVFIAKKEASETKYWLAIIAKLTNDAGEVAELSERTQKFVMMLQKIVNTSKDANRKSPIVNASEMANR
ncbi:four helix bundle protein [Candidatus Saccharibacteria bacterium]|nr:MAG: four helix bundle protein [Candidatus Saccharibacteria bacterium]